MKNLNRYFYYILKKNMFKYYLLFNLNKNNINIFIIYQCNNQYIQHHFQYLFLIVY